MSYLSLPRLVFAGRFQADVSTINNIAANYNTSSSSPVTELWNPDGTNGFRLLDCKVTNAISQAGAAAPEDPILACVVTGSDDHSSAKLVDLDPSWQMSSEIWGLQVRIVSRASGAALLEGDFEVAAFRDLFFRQPRFDVRGQQPPDHARNGQPRGASFVSMIKNITWFPESSNSVFIKSLRQVSETELSIVFNTYGFYYTKIDGLRDRFATGNLVGCLGPRLENEPKTFVVGRRLEATHVQREHEPITILNASVATISETQLSVSLDLGNALPVSDLSGGLLNILEELNISSAEALVFGFGNISEFGAGDHLTSSDYTELGHIPYLSLNWLHQTAGITTYSMTEEELQQVAELPFAIAARLEDGSYLVLSRETRDGLFVRADNFVQRLDPRDSAKVKFFATRYGRPLAGHPIYFDSAPVISTNSITTNQVGIAELDLVAVDPGNPRGSIDGIVVQIPYSLQLDQNGLPDYRGLGLDPGLDQVIVHVRDGYSTPIRPEWHRDVKPIFDQYARLYPIMSQQLFDLSSYESVVRYRQPLLYSFKLNINHPSYMPLSRDLSRAKQDMIIRWLENETGDANEPLLKGEAFVAEAAPSESMTRLAAKLSSGLGDDPKSIYSPQKFSAAIPASKFKHA